GVWGSLPIVTMSGPDCTIFSTSRRILRRSMSRFFRTLAATPEPSLTRPRRMCSVPMYSWLKRCASWQASCITLRARSVKRSYMHVLLHCLDGISGNEPIDHRQPLDVGEALGAVRDKGHPVHKRRGRYKAIRP